MSAADHGDSTRPQGADVAEFTVEEESGLRRAGTGQGGAPSPSELRGRLGVAGLLFAVLAYNAPMGIFAAFLGVVIGNGNGLGAPLTFVVAGIILALFAVGFTTMGRHLPNPGAFYAYVSAGLGRMPGLAGCFVAVVAYNLVLLGNYLFFGIAAQSLVRDTFHGPELPWWLFVVLLMAFVAAIGYLNVDVSAKVLGVALVFELSAMASYDVVVLSQGGAEGIDRSSLSLDAFTSGSLGIALLFSMTMFGGFEATAVFREEVRDPERTVPRTTYLAVAVITVLYAVTTWAIIVAIGPSSVVADTAADPTGSVLTSVETYLGVLGRDVVTVLVLTSNLAATLATHNVSSRYVFSLSHDGIPAQTPCPGSRPAWFTAPVVDAHECRHARYLRHPPGDSRRRPNPLRHRHRSGWLRDPCPHPGHRSGDSGLPASQPV